MHESARELVARRSANRCEYCRLPQGSAPFFTFHVEHILARQHGGSDEMSNLALACPDCNRFKGPNLSSVDPDTDEIVALFNPRQDTWREHFLFRGPWILGRTPVGRATVRLLNMNEDERLTMRAVLLSRGEL